MIKNFKSFTSVEKITENVDYYTENGYITNDMFKNDKDLLDHIEKNIIKAWDFFSKELNLPKSSITVEETRGKHKINLESESFTEKEMGVFSKCFKSANLIFFGGRDIRFATKDEKFLFVPYIWTNLSVAYEQASGGSNAVNYTVSNEDGRSSDDVYYDIIDNKWHTSKAFIKKFYK